jgi:hypothetical protein
VMDGRAGVEYEAGELRGALFIRYDTAGVFEMSERNRDIVPRKTKLGVYRQGDDEEVEERKEGRRRGAE